MDIRGFEVVSAFEEQDINLPTRKTTESAGYDIECAEAITLEPGEIKLVPTGLKAFMAYDEYLAIHKCQMTFNSHARTNVNGKIFIVCHKSFNTRWHQNHLTRF